MSIKKIQNVHIFVIIEATLAITGISVTVIAFQDQEIECIITAITGYIDINPVIF